MNYTIITVNELPQIQYYNRRGKNGRYIKRTQRQQNDIDYYSNTQIPEYRYDSEGNREKVTYRAVVTLNNVPIHSDKARGRPRYKNFSWAKVDYYENININEMKKHLLQEIANHFHCKIDDLWFVYNQVPEEPTEWGDIEYPKPYRGSIWEGLEYGEY
jgi:hypothetical protein